MRFATRALAGMLAASLTAAVPAPGYAFQTTTNRSDPATTRAAATMPAGAVALTARVTSVRGNVQVRAAEGAPWQPVTVGLGLDQGAEIRTGLRSAVQFVIGDDETITLDRLGTVTVLQAFRDRGRAKTDLGLKYGRARYDIRETDLEHESTIRSPGSTLAIRGTDVTYEDQAPWVPIAVSREGRAEFRNFKRQFVAFGGTRRASVAADKAGPAQTAVAATVADPRGAFAGRTEAEQQLNEAVQPLGGADAEVQRAVQDVLRGFTAGPDTSAPTLINGRGPLEFTLEWMSAAGQPGPTNLDLLITDPRGEVVSAMNPVIGSGVEQGQHFGDDPGASGIGGERVAWGEFFPLGTYTVRAVHAGGDDAQLTLTGFQGEGPGLITTVIAGGDPTAPVVLKPGETFTGTLRPAASSSSQSNVRAARRADRQQQRQALQQQRNLAAAARGARQGGR